MNPQEFWRIYRDIFRRRWLGLAIFGASFGVVLLGCIFMPRYYRASAYVMPSEAALSKPIIPGTGTSLSLDSVPRVVDPRVKEEQMATLMGLAGTAEVRQRTIDSLGLKATLEDLSELVKVEPGAGRIIKISALSRTSREAILLANGIAHQFAVYYEHIRGNQARRNREFLEREVADVRAERLQAKAELQTFKSEQGEAALPTGTDRNPFLSQFYALRARIDDTKSRLQSVDGRLGAVWKELARQSPTREVERSTTDNPVTQQLQDELARLQKELAVAQSRYTEKHRKVKELKAQIEDMKQRLSSEEDRMITNRTVEGNPVHEKLREQIVDLTAERAGLSSELSALTAAMAENERRAGRLADSSVLLLAKTREFEETQARYERLKTMLEGARVEEKTSKADSIEVVDEAKSAVGPVLKKGPSSLQLLLFGLVLSLCLSLGTLLVLSYLDDRVQGEADLLRRLSLPVPAVIPELSAGSGKAPLGRITELQPLSPHAEAYRFLRTEITHFTGPKPLRTLLVAAARPGHGGTTTAANLAIALAEVGNRVVLVDADLRRPKLHECFGETNDAGLTTLLSNGYAAAVNALRRTSMENLLLLPAGPPVGNPAALLSSNRMQLLLEQLRQHSDYVVIDAPSAATFADAAVLGPLVDGVILVMRANHSVREAEHRTKELFAKVGANIVGVVLNSAVPQTVDSYYFHSHYYPVVPSLPASTGRADALPPHRLAEPVEPQPKATEPTTTRAPSRHRAPELTAIRVKLPDWDGRAGGPLARTQTSQSGASAHRPVLLGTATGGGWSVRTAAAGAAALAVLAGLLAWAGPRLRSESAKGRPGLSAISAPQGAAVTVMAMVKQPVSVRVDRDGKLLYEGPLTTGQQIWRASRNVTVWANPPEALELTVNGQFIGPLGKAGDLPASKQFTWEDGGQ